MRFRVCSVDSVSVEIWRWPVQTQPFIPEFDGAVEDGVSEEGLKDLTFETDDFSLLGVYESAPIVDDEAPREFSVRFEDHDESIFEPFSRLDMAIKLTSTPYANLHLDQELDLFDVSRLARQFPSSKDINS